MANNHNITVNVTKDETPEKEFSAFNATTSTDAEEKPSGQDAFKELLERQNQEPKCEPNPTPKEEPTPEAEPEGPENPLKLKHPILINGVKRRELKWSDDISSEQFLDADSRAHGTRASIATAEMDTGFHFWLGAMMIVAANPEIDPKDLEQIKGKDIPALMRIGRFFMLPDQDAD